MTLSLIRERIRPTTSCFAAPHRQFPLLAGIATRAKSVDRCVSVWGERGHPGSDRRGENRGCILPRDLADADRGVGRVVNTLRQPHPSALEQPGAASSALF